MAKKTLIIGLGQSGLAVAKFLSQKLLPFCVYDTRENPPNLKLFQKSYPEVDCYFAETSEYKLNKLFTCDQVILSPGVPDSIEIVQQAIKKNIPVISEVELFARYVNAPVVAITGSNGKSTVTALLGEMAKADNMNVGVGGNLGEPAISLLAPNRELYILELSSFQLEHTYSLKPEIATILNITPDHIDRHGSFENYQKAKYRIYNNAKVILLHANQEVFLTQENRQCSKIIEKVELIQGWKKVNFALAGDHNKENYFTAIALAKLLTFKTQAIQAGIENFTGLPFRCEKIAFKDEVTWINDSKGTNLGATLAAVAGLKNSISGQWVLILGGQGKAQDFSPLKNALNQKIKTVVLLGEDAKLIAESIPEDLKKIFVSNLEQAVIQSKNIAQAGDGVLFSPACASFDMFENYVKRGEAFNALVNAFV